VASASFAAVSKRFGTVEAVRELTLEIADGELMVLVGPSGSGKTTALRMLAGLEAVDGGEISIGDRVVNAVSPRDRDVAMVFQDYALYPQMTVRDNMAFGLRRRGLERSEVDRRVSETCATLGLDTLLDRRPRELSGGQQQRVALGRALVRRPQVLLMDEPLSNLDAQLRVQARGEIRRLQSEVGTTMVYVTHDQVEALTLGDRITVMNDGALEQVGTPEELYERPANVFVGGFIGSPGMSFLPAEDGVVVGVRPEHVRPWEDGLVGPIEGRVAFVEALGRETLLGVDTDAGARLVAAVEGRPAFTVGEPIRVGLVETGMRRFGAGGRLAA
jgi:multiple sugar transport system ATP-binding protein